MSDCIVVFTKVPAHGVGKQRLAAQIGAENARVLAEKLLTCTLDNALAVGADVACSYSGDTARLIALLDGRPVQLLPRPDGDLEFQQQFVELPGDLLSIGYERVVLLPSDAPGVGPDLIQSGLESLGAADVVISPATDGGFAVLMTRSRLPQRLRFVNLSLLDQVHEALTAAGLNLEFVDSRTDIDDRWSLDQAVCHGELTSHPELLEIWASLDSTSTHSSSGGGADAQRA